jgi:hypothetical protein
MTKSEELKLEAWRLWLISHNMDFKDSEAKLQDWSYGQVFSSAWDAAVKAVKSQIEYLWIEPEEKQNLLATKIFNVEFDMRAYNCMRAEGIQTLGDLIKYSERDLMRVPNMGRKTIKGIQEVLATRSLTLKGPPKDFTSKKQPVIEDYRDQKKSNVDKLTAYANECRKRRTMIYNQYKNENKTIRELGDLHGVTPGRIHQIIKRAEREIRQKNSQLPPLESIKAAAMERPIPPWLREDQVNESNHG